MSPAQGPSLGRVLARAALGAGLLVGTRCALVPPAGQRADVRAGQAMRRIGSPRLDRVVTATTDLGSMYAVCGMAAVLAAAGHRGTAADILGLGTTAWVVAQRSKRLVRRRRPYEADGEADGVRRLVRPPAGSSFPSGHASVALATTCLLAERVAAQRGGARRRVAAALPAVGAYVAASRVHVGVHYPADVVGGAGLGVLLCSLWRGPVAAVARAGTGLVAGTLAPVLAGGAARVAFGAGRSVRGAPRRRAATSGRAA